MSIILIILNLGFLTSPHEAVQLEHNFAMPWLRLQRTLHYYENISEFFSLYDAVMPANVLPISIKRRTLRTECNREEQGWCLGKDKCRMNLLPSPNLDMSTRAFTSNQAHYQCSCEDEDVSVDLLVSLTRSKKNKVTRVIHTKCPKTPACEQCDPEHTVKCIDLGEDKVRCLCDPNYMESTNCEQLKNGCTQPHPAATLKGDEACRVEENQNKCFPIPQSLFYTCLCYEPSMEDRALSFPNCMGNWTKCTQPLCIGFQPPLVDTIPGPSISLDEVSPVGQTDICNQTKCDCPKGWFGPNCLERRGQSVLSAWSPWSTCTPDCILPNEKSRYSRLEDWHAGTSRTTAIGFRSKLGRCDVADFDSCVGTFRFWRRCRVTQLCNAWTNTRLSAVVNEAVGAAMIEHDKVHRKDRIEPLLTTAASLTWTEFHCLNFILIGGTLILTCMCIWVMEMHHFIITFNS